MLRNPRKEETDLLLQIAEATGIFSEGEVKSLLGEVLEAFHSNQLGSFHFIDIWADSHDQAKGWTYYSSDEEGDGIYDLWWIGVIPDHQGSGIGRELLGAAENRVQSLGGRSMRIETSSQPNFEPTWKFYKMSGYA